MISRTPRTLLAWAVAPALLAVGLAGCGTIPTPASGGERTNSPATNAPAITAPATDSPQDPASSGTPTPTVDPVSLSANVKDGASSVKVDTVVKAKAENGRLTKVALSWSGPDGHGVMQKGTVDGKLSSDGASWTADDRLEPRATYKLKLTGTATDGTATEKSSEFSTQSLTLAQETFPELYPLKGSTVGVGMPVVLRFDTAVTDKANFEKHLTVTSTPKQTGSWHWYNDKEVHYRPATFWQPGTKVSVTADTNSLDAGNGIYGQKSTSTTFTIGRSLVTKVNLKTHKAKVYINDKLARTIPISAGKPGWVTRSGTKLIMDKLYKTQMTNEMIGATEDYDLTVYYAMRITNSGEFLHAAPWNSANMGSANTSHGCTGMNTSDAKWLYDRVEIGDPVITTGSDRGIEPLNGYSDWNASFSTYKKASAL